MQQKKLIFKTAIISLWVIIVLLLSLFGILSYCAPVAMMNLTSALGLDSMSGDYAYEEYVRSGNIEYLARAFEVAAEDERDAKANTLFDTFYAHEDFAKYCGEQDDIVINDKNGIELSRIFYRDLVCGQAAQVKYRLASADEEKAAVAEFARAETETSFPTGNPLFALSLEAARAEDSKFCASLLDTLRAGGFSEENSSYTNIVNILEKVAEE